MNRCQSQYYPENTLQSCTVQFTASGAGVRFVQKTVTDCGNTVESEYTVAYDGKDAPITGSTLDTVSLKRVNVNAVERTGKIARKQVEIATLTISAGGEVSTIVTDGSVDGDM